MSADGSTGQRVTPWATGPIVFAGAMLVITGVLQIFTAVMALAHDRIYEGTPQYLFAFDLTVWGWLLLLAGILSMAAGFGALRAQTWARAVGIATAAFSTLVQFLFIPHYPVWSILVIAVDVTIIWALATHRRDTV